MIRCGDTGDAVGYIWTSEGIESILDVVVVIGDIGIIGVGS